MPKVKRPVRERTEDWTQVRLLVAWPEQMAYELIRPVVLYGETAAERARETGENERTIERKADSFDRQGMLGLFPAGIVNLSTYLRGLTRIYAILRA